MLLTTNLIKFNHYLIKIPPETRRIKDLSENRWGYKQLQKY